MELEIEEELDLSGYRGHGKLEHEIALPDEEPTAPRTTPDIPASVRFVAGELMLMGFCENACYRAAYYSNGNVEVIGIQLTVSNLILPDCIKLAHGAYGRL